MLFDGQHFALIQQWDGVRPCTGAGGGAYTYCHREGNRCRWLIARVEWMHYLVGILTNTLGNRPCQYIVGLTKEVLQAGVR